MPVSAHATGVPICGSPLAAGSFSHHTYSADNEEGERGGLFGHHAYAGVWGKTPQDGPPNLCACDCAIVCTNGATRLSETTCSALLAWIEQKGLWQPCNLKTGPERPCGLVESTSASRRMERTGVFGCTFSRGRAAMPCRATVADGPCHRYTAFPAPNFHSVQRLAPQPWLKT